MCRPVASKYFFGGWFFVLVCSWSNAAANDDLIPPPKLRPADPTKFFSASVRIVPADLEKAQTLLIEKLAQPELAERVRENGSLAPLRKEPEAMLALLDSPARVREWALKTLGEFRGDKAFAKAKLLKLTGDAELPEATRALAARVAGTAGLEPKEVLALAENLDGARNDFQVLLLEIIKAQGPSAAACRDSLEKYLRAPSAAVQFAAYTALESIEPSGREVSLNPEEALSSSDSRGYIIAHCLLAVAKRNGGPASLAAPVLRRVADQDEFISQLAANVFARCDWLVEIAPLLNAHVADSHPAVRRAAIAALARLSSRPKAALPALVAALERARQHGAAPAEVGACLDALRVMKTNAASAAQAVLALLPEHCRIYRNLQKHQVQQLRGYALLTLADIGVPREALPHIMDGLANSEDDMSYLFAASARAAGALGREGRDAIPFLLRALGGTVKDRLINFEKFGAHGRSIRDYTSCRIEALRALRKIGPDAAAVVPALEQSLGHLLQQSNNPAPPQHWPDLRKEAAETIATLRRQRVSE